MKQTDKMKIGILQCGRIPPELIGSHDDYNAMFVTFLGEQHFEFRTWAVLDDELPEDINDADGWLITGSRHGVYEDHAWIAPLEAHIRAVYAAGIPLFGVCFGHQIMAQALGGKVVKFDGGWSVGHVEYAIEQEPDGSAARQQSLGVHAFHQDQIISLPPDARAFASTDFCQYAFVRYQGHALSIQPHPEFSDQYLQDLLRVRGKVLPTEIVSAARQSIGKALDTDIIARDVRRFFLDSRRAGRKQTA